MGKVRRVGITRHTEEGVFDKKRLKMTSLFARKVEVNDERKQWVGVPDFKGDKK